MGFLPLVFVPYLRVPGITSVSTAAFASVALTAADSYADYLRVPIIVRSPQEYGILRVHFTSFVTETHFDFLQVFDSSRTEWQSHLKFTGRDLEGATLLASGGQCCPPPSLHPASYLESLRRVPTAECFF